MPERPSMHARDSSGRRVSLLNDEPPPVVATLVQRPALRAHVSTPSSHLSARSNSAWSLQSSSSLEMPVLLRSESFDSHSTIETRSPITPDHPYAMASHLFPPTMHALKDPLPYDAHFDGYSFDARPSMTHQRHDSFNSRHADDEHMLDESALERVAKRYPCRYRDSHGCEKTFTTSGHASRHSKIHTAEKAVQCTFENCTKKFTRSDNMKQHLETHNKEKDRAPRLPSHKSSGSRSGLMLPAGVKKAAGSKKVATHPSPIPYAQSSTLKPEYATMHGVAPSTMYASYASGPSQQSSYNPFEMEGFCHVLLSRPTPARTDSGGLDVLAQAAASVPGKSMHRH